MKAQKTLTHFIGDRLGKKSLYFLLEAKKSSREQKTSGRFIFSSFLNIPRQSASSRNIAIIQSFQGSIVFISLTPKEDFSSSHFYRIYCERHVKKRQ